MTIFMMRRNDSVSAGTHCGRSVRERESDERWRGERDRERERERGRER